MQTSEKRVLPINIFGENFYHAIGDDESMARSVRGNLSMVATHAWDLGQYEKGPLVGNQVLLMNASRDSVIGLYRIRIHPGGGASCLLAPMWPEISVSRVGCSMDPSGAEINSSEREVSELKQCAFWKKTFAVIERLLAEGLSFSDGSHVSIDFLRFPSLEEGDPPQHFWKMNEHWNLFSKVSPVLDGERVERTGEIKSVDPDPNRPFGDINV